MKSESLNVKVYGAGSIGNHLSRASRRMGWNVTVVDTNKEALRRMKEEIYPKRYGEWDETITQYVSGEEPEAEYDLVIVGTPPDSHLSIAQKVLGGKYPPKVLQLEKPLCSPIAGEIEDFEKLAHDSKTKIVVGYNYVVSDGILKIEELIQQNDLGALLSLDVDLLAHWGDILRAHPWLTGPADTYLGYWKKGGGASGEHSHALNLWQHLAHVAGAGKVTKTHAFMDYVRDGEADYDRVCLLNLTTEKGAFGRVGQDVTTMPTEKRAVMRFEKGHIEWRGAIRPGVDEIRFYLYEKGTEPQVFEVELTPADSYLREITHIGEMIADPSLFEHSPIRLERGLDTMRVLLDAHVDAPKA